MTFSERVRLLQRSAAASIWLLPRFDGQRDALSRADLLKRSSGAFSRVEECPPQKREWRTQWLRRSKPTITAVPNSKNRQKGSLISQRQHIRFFAAQGGANFLGWLGKADRPQSLDRGSRQHLLLLAQPRLTGYPMPAPIYSFVNKESTTIRNPERSSTNISRALRRQQILSPAAGKVIALLAAS